MTNYILDLFRRRKPKTPAKPVQTANVKGSNNTVNQTASASGYPSRSDRYTTGYPYDPMTDMLNPLNPMSPYNIGSSSSDYSPSPSSCDSGSSSYSSSYDSGSSSSSDSGSSSSCSSD